MNLLFLLFLIGCNGKQKLEFKNARACISSYPGNSYVGLKMCQEKYPILTFENSGLYSSHPLDIRYSGSELSFFFHVYNVAVSDEQYLMDELQNGVKYSEAVKIAAKKW